MLPNFIGIGAPKAGTTWLFQCLREHPQVFIAPCKETNFFDYGTIAGRLHEYQAHFSGAAGQLAVGEISTRYLTSMCAPERILNYLPAARLFVTLRNPIEQIYSHYWHLSRQNFHQWSRATAPATFEQALEQYQDRLLGPARYARHIERWLKHFDRSQLLVILYDDIETRPAEVMQTLCEFLRVDARFQAPSLQRRDATVRQGTSPRSPLHARLHASLYRQINRGLYAPLKKIVGTNSAIRLKDTLRVRPIMEALFQRQGYPPMSRQTRALLYDRVAPDIQELAGLIDRDLSRWQ